MRNISNVADLNGELRTLAQNVMPSVADKIAKTGQKYVQEIVYNAYKKPKWGFKYNRTYQLKKNLVNLGSTSFERNKIEYAVGYNLKDFRYSSVVNGYTTDGTLIPRLVEEGNTGAMYKKGKWYDQDYYNPRKHTFAQPRPFFQTFKKDVGSKLFIEQFEKELDRKKVVYEKGE